MSLPNRILLAAVVALLPAQLATAFTAEQAATGRASYEQFCVACHGADLRMLPTAPLAGQEFAAKWRTRSTNDLLAQLRTTMPPESPGSLGEQPRGDPHLVCQFAHSRRHLLGNPIDLQGKRERKILLDRA